MGVLKILFLSFLIQLSFVSGVQAGDFGWLDDLAVEAGVDPSGVRARIAARFHIGDAEVRAVIDEVGGHANAYMVLRLSEMSHLSLDVVIQRYHDNQGKGWGVLAKRLGIKPGSPEFHALKRGHDLYANGSTTKKGKNNTKGNGKGNPNKRN